jgi:7-cyano-7-deazaguanine synthase
LQFLEAIDGSLSYSTLNGVKVLAPLIDLGKSAIVRQALQAGAPLEWSWSCYQDGDAPCGVCESCVRRIRAFLELEIEDPLLERLGVKF